jgi:hypothetical protein
MRRRQTLSIAGASALMVMILSAACAGAQNTVLYEVTESMTTRGLKNPHRVATAALFGAATIGAPICPAALGVTSCGVNVQASDNIDLATGKGPVNGSFQVVIQGDNPVDGPELLVLEGHLSGDVNLSPTLQQIPLGTIAGTWSARGLRDSHLRGVKLTGTFTGTFRLPFLSGTTPSYLLDSGSVVPVEPDEFSIGFPAVRLEISFQQ